MPFEPVSPLGGFTGLDEAPEQQVQPAPTTSDAWEAAYRTGNTVVSSVISQARRFSGAKVDRDFDPWAEIAGTPYEPYTDQFAVATNKQHADAIKADIDRELKDRDTIAKSGWIGIGASMAAGFFDPAILVPGGAIVRR